MSEHCLRIPTKFVVTVPHPVEGFDFALSGDVTEWCLDNIGYLPVVEGRTEIVEVTLSTGRKFKSTFGYYVSLFDDDNSAMHFKLRWCDGVP